jgi:effector-binding domain-containing protein
MTQNVFKKYIVATLCFLVVLSVISVVLPTEVKRKYSYKTSIPINHTKNLLVSVENLPFWHPNLKGENIFTLESPSTFDYQTKNNLSGKISYNTLTKDSCILVDIGSKETKKFIIYLKTIENGSTEIVIDGNQETGYIHNLMNFIEGYKLKSEMKKICLELENELKNRMEKSIYCGINLKDHSINTKYFVYLKSQMDITKKIDYYSQNISTVYQKVQDAGIKSINNPCILYFGNNNSEIYTFGAAIETLTESNVKSLESETIQGGIVKKIEINGARNDFRIMYHALQEYMKDNKLELQYPIVEEYISNPSQEADQTKWKTIIYAPLYPIHLIQKNNEKLGI